MNESTLTAVSNQMADAAAAVADAVVQVHGRRQPASGVVYAPDVVVTTARALGREDGVPVRRPDGTVVDAELAGWDPATRLAVLRAPGLSLPAATAAAAPARVGHLALAIARSWSNALTASAGIVAVIGGPLPTGRGRRIEQVIRTTAPMHQGFSGGAFINTSGELIGITTAVEIRGLGVVIPSSIAWKAAADVLEHGRSRRGYLGIACQTVRLGERQQFVEGHDRALLVVHVASGSPAESAGVLVGDLLTGFDGQDVTSAEALLEALGADRAGQAATLRLVRGAQALDIDVTIGERSQ